MYNHSTRYKNRTKPEKGYGAKRNNRGYEFQSICIVCTAKCPIKGIVMAISDGVWRNIEKLRSPVGYRGMRIGVVREKVGRIANLRSHLKYRNGISANIKRWRINFVVINFVVYRSPSQILFRFAAVVGDKIFLWTNLTESSTVTRKTKQIIRS